VTLTVILSFALFASLLVISPGPNGVLIAKTVPTSGKAAGFANIAGFVTGFYIHGIMVIFGISFILTHSANLFFAVKLAGAAYLIWIGAKALIDAWKGFDHVDPVKPAKRTRTLAKAYMEGLLTNVLNPKVAMFYLAAFPQFVPTELTTPGNTLMLVTVHSAINTLWFASMVLLFARFSQAARNSHAQRWIKSITGIVFVGFGAKLLTIESNS